MDLGRIKNIDNFSLENVDAHFGGHLKMSIVT